MPIFGLFVLGLSERLLATYIDLFFKVTSAYSRIVFICRMASGPVRGYIFISNSSPESPVASSI